MKGERAAWYELASHLGLPLQVVQNQTTSNEFVEWCYHLEKRSKRREPIHWYLAQIALEIRRSTNPKKRFKLEQFLLSFESGKTFKAPKTAQEKEEHIARSKAFWFGTIMGTQR